ncbi:DUF3794 domain-containing protein [Halobacillus kuroshimensis]|uniref:DUF3794 domain-containing protein n=1 Tax=Halobacillus kuroshimensis TaxID=302481 RepID=A0ABS3DWT4_9BACI|nr:MULTISPECIES: hypothetical protein [Halobacillus]MBN8235703.1 DUF3794 domain-containing protein [Halobacillus kuroshimensis]
MTGVFNEEDGLELHCERKPHVSIGKIVTKVPVVLAELKLQIHVSETITFPEPVLEIKDIKKRVHLTQCRLLLPSKKLFIKGFVRKNIQYASPCSEIEMPTDKSVASDLHSFTVDVPFEQVTEIKDFLSMPVMPKNNTREEFDFVRSKSLPEGFPEKDQHISSDISQYHQESSQFYNELPYCELLSSRIVEWDEALDRMPLPGKAPFHEGYFTKIEEKMVLDICVNVLQKQQIRVASTSNGD